MWQEFEKAICTDAACPSNPWPIEYRGVIVSTGKEVFNYGPLDWWSVNIAEFLAIVEWLKRLLQNQKYTILYSDSKTAIWWIKKGAINTTITKNKNNTILFEIIHESIQWLKLNSDRSNYITLSKRPTSQRGQIPADFWRK
jgi:ribonuclease HI